MNQFFVTAIAEKVSALKTEVHFRECQERSDLADFDAWLAASPAEPGRRHLERRRSITADTALRVER